MNLRRPALLGLSLLACFSVACSSEFERFERHASARGTLGEEAYKVVCRRIAGTEMPQDLAGRQSQAVCMGDAATVQQALSEPTLPARVRAVAARRASITRAVDDLLPGELSDELEHLFRRIQPLYDPPEERVQNATRAIAGLLERMIDPSQAAALSGIARVSRKGMLPPDGTLGAVRAMLGASHLRDVGRSVLPPAMDDPAVRPHYETLLSGLALELATAEADEEAQRDADRLRKLVLRTDPAFGSGRPLLATRRDARGLPLPTSRGAERVPFPFVDSDGDGLADADGPFLRTQASFGRAAPEPYPVEGEGPTAREPGTGRAYALSPTGESDPSRLLYQSTDVDPTLLAGMLRSAQKLFASGDFASSLGAAVPAIVGPYVPTTKRYGAHELAYTAPDLRASPLLDLVHASGALVDRPILSDSLALASTLLRDEEAALTGALAPLITLERRTRPTQDAYPGAKLRARHTMWDELLGEAEKVARRRMTKDGETLLEAIMRASLGFGRNLDKPGTPIEQVVDPEILRHQGAMLATLMRFKDEWRANPKGESERVPGDPLVIGGFRTPVDRTKPDTPITCGRDGCGGPIDATPFARWKKPQQNCVIQRSGRPISGKDCGQPANQSLLQRSLGLVSEMAGRAQCNKPISIGDMLDFAVLKDPCVGDVLPDTPQCEALRRQQRADRARSIESAEQAVRNDYTCPETPGAPCRAYAARYPAAFVDPDGPGVGQPASIKACHMLDLPDVGRTFGAVVLRQFQIEFPNPWVRRYLEDIARAGDHEDADDLPDLPACPPDFRIVDPTVAPPCTPEAARLSRNLYEDDPKKAARLKSVDELGELIAFLLDDSRLFATPADMRALKPDPKALSRVLFAAAGSSSFVMFDPLLVHGAPPLCSDKPALPACAADDTSPMPSGGCCIKDPKRPPLRFRLDTFYGATSFAWEQPIQLTDGRSISFLDSMRALSDAVTRFDFDAKRDDPRLFEDTGYLFSTFGKLIAQHYDSAGNPIAQDRDPSAPHYRHLTGVVSYEPMLADALDDGMVDMTQLGPDGKALFSPEQRFTPEQQLGLVYHSLPLLQALDRTTVEGGRDGIDLGAEMAEQLLNPHVRCAGSQGDRRVLGGEGACHRALRREPGFEPPFRYRDGRAHLCWSDGRCFDGQREPLRFVSPLFATADAIGAMQRAAADDPMRKAGLRGVLSAFVDAYGQLEPGRFADRRFHALVLTMLAHTRERVAEERAAGTLGTLAERGDRDAADALHNPVIAGALGLFAGLSGKGSALRDLGAFSASVLRDDATQSNLRPLLAGLYDMVQMMPGNDETRAAMRLFGAGFAVDVERALRGEPVALSPQTSAVGRNLFMLRATAHEDDALVMERVLANLARVPEGRPSPLESIADSVIAVNRVVPGSVATPTAEDLRATLTRVAQVMRDERRGIERLFQIVRCSRSGAGTPGCE